MTQTNFPIFQVGDEVKYELSGIGFEPRWNHAIDHGGNGDWAIAKIIRAVTNSVETKCDNGFSWFWPLLGGADFDDDQWGRPGFLRHKEEIKPKQPRVRIVDMGAYFKSVPVVD